MNEGNTMNPTVGNTNTDSTEEIPKLNQEVLFVITHYALFLLCRN